MASWPPGRSAPRPAPPRRPAVRHADPNRRWYVRVLDSTGWLLGRPGTEAGLIPAHYIESLVGGESFQACLFASLSGALMYFATLTEIPILQGLLGAGMGKGPALSLLLAGPAISLPSLLALRSIMGWKKTVVYALLVILFSTLAGYFYGAI